MLDETARATVGAIVSATVSATEANRAFSRLLRSVEEGAAVIITKDGRPVAVMRPVTAADPGTAVRTRERMLRLMEEGLPIGYGGGLDRDELHRR